MQHSGIPRRRWQFLLMLLLGYYTGLDAADGLAGTKAYPQRWLDILSSRQDWQRGVCSSAAGCFGADESIASRGPLVRMGVGKERFRQVMRGLFDHANAALQLQDAP